MKRLVHNLTILLTTAILLSSSFIIVGGSLSCSSPYSDEHFVGNACTAEKISMGTVWSWSETTTALPAQKFFLLVAILVAVTPATYLRMSAIMRGLTWFNRRPNLARGRPSPNNEFLPYLFATHGW
ncbi:MAG: hypothetical protein UY76_C0002G0006 [Candidatus Uhrbacteria bacterium GW2011_GWA2_52_8d]|uniref:Uncharacterized protein n=1 Tax=Candidatus Uhrbacteria bacterium GW2011_GWA2_52_8d TaxID=1618979 RepID=A0A0G1ZYC8_9BACT|nr:MAG: hypothetical protein UY76_C0002G0006 [Candidatus Uhrbacteria bacterium GW2011_GWA2_52_8d]